MTEEDAVELERCLAGGGVVLFPTDTVYGLGCDPASPAAVDRLYRLKGRPPAQPSAVLFFDLEPALGTLGWLGQRTRGALTRLLPGPVTALLPNPERLYPLACGPSPERLGLRVPLLGDSLAALGGVRSPLLQSSANLSGGRDAARLGDVEPSLREGVDLELDAGELPGVPSTVLDLSEYEETGRFTVVREGAVASTAVEAALG